MQKHELINTLVSLTDNLEWVVRQAIRLEDNCQNDEQWVQLRKLREKSEKLLARAKVVEL
jgi:hypothetical protein